MRERSERGGVRGGGAPPGEENFLIGRSATAILLAWTLDSDGVARSARRRANCSWPLLLIGERGIIIACVYAPHGTLGCSTSGAARTHFHLET